MGRQREGRGFAGGMGKEGKAEGAEVMIERGRGEGMGRKERA